MSRLTDSELIEELKRRSDDNLKSLHDLKIMTGKLENLNKKLQESEKLKSNFLSNIRNEINNPLTSILCISKVIMDGDEKEIENIISMSESIYKEAFSLDFQLRNIFAAAELEAGEAFPSIARVDIDMIIGEVVGQFSRRAEEKRMTVSYETMGSIGEDPLFMSDPEKLQIVIANLLSNAIEFSHDEGSVEIKAMRAGSDLAISVQDHGVGIEESEQGTIFDRFRQLDSGVTKSHLGHGLGASITKAIVDLLNGSIAVSSKKDAGSLFTVLVPEAEGGSEVNMYSGDSNEFFFEAEEEQQF